MSTIAVPALLRVIIGIMFMANRGTGGGKHVVIASTDAALANAVKAAPPRGQGRQSNVEVVAPATPEIGRTCHRVSTKDIDGFLWIETPPARSPQRCTSPNRQAIS